MRTSNFKTLFVSFFFLTVFSVGYAQSDAGVLNNIDSKVLGEAMLRYQKGQINEDAFSKVLKAKIVPSESIAEIKEKLIITQEEIKTQSGQSLEAIVKESDLKLSGAFYEIARKVTDMDPSSFKNVNAYFAAVEKIIQDSSLDKNGIEYSVLSAATLSSKAYVDASQSNDLKITHSQSVDNIQLVTQGWWNNWGQSVCKIVGGAITGGVTGISGGIPGIIVGAIGGAISGLGNSDFHKDH